MLNIVMVAAALAGGPADGNPDVSERSIFAIVERRPAFEEATNLRIGTLEHLQMLQNPAY
jgi:hypothetical protein